MKKLTAVASLLVAINTANAQTMFGHQANCGQWVTRKQTHNDFIEVWLLGYLSGINSAMMFNGQKDALKQLSSVEQVTVWVDNYCKANPLERLYVAGRLLYSELLKRADKQ